jgi:hypothetical protein
VWHNARVNMIVSQSGEDRGGKRSATSLSDTGSPATPRQPQNGAVASLCPRGSYDPGHEARPGAPPFSVACGWLSTLNMSKRTFAVNNVICNLFAISIMQTFCPKRVNTIYAQVSLHKSVAQKSRIFYFRM